MFAYLLSRNRHGTRKETLIDLLWPDQTDDERASSVFHLTLHYLRRALEPDLKSMAASSYIRYKNGRYYFDPLKRYWFDVDAFEANCRRAEKCNQCGDSEAAMLSWGMALDLYRGDYMAGIHPDYNEDPDHDWYLARRQRLRELYLTALLEMAHYHFNVREYGLCIERARAVLEVEPTFEPAHGLIMHCFINCSQPAQAMHQYGVCKAALTRYEDRLPSEPTRQIYEQLTACVTDE
jgi:two-component SAPR family response regulator